MSECTHDCGSCSKSCGERKEPESLLAPMNKNSSVKKVIAVVSGKGGVGKSTVTSLLATAASKAGHKVAVLDADITGPSIPKAFGMHQQATGSEDGINPVVTQRGIELMSINLLLPDESDPVIWRGPVINGVVQQFWSDVHWGDIDYMFVDMPPGTGDVPLTVFQSLPVDGIVVVTTPQDLVTMIVTKAYKMAKMMNVPVLGIVENMSYFHCPDCGKDHAIFGESKVEEVAKDLGVKVLAKLPIDPTTASLEDAGQIEMADTKPLENALKEITK